MTQAVWATAPGHFLEVTNLAGADVPTWLAFRPDHRRVGVALVGVAEYTMLGVAQAAAVALGALPVYWLGRKRLRSQRAGVGFALAYCFIRPRSG